MIVTAVSLYNQTTPDDVFVAGFVARHATLAALLRRLRAAKAEEDAHHILIGPRGMGKTSLLRRIAIAITREAALAARYVPLTFREEQYNVLRLGDFWRNCGEALAEWAEAGGRGELAQRLDAELLTPAWDDTHAGDRFQAEMDALGRRAVLLVDNLDLILDEIGKEGNWTLRRYLLAQNGPVMIGAATQPLAQSANRDEAFYQFFQPEYLTPLDARETETCMRALATANGAEGKRVLATLDHQPERLRTLHTLTGGNPRVLALVYRLLATDETGAAMADLEVLLDQVTPYFKARVEEYTSAHQRAVIDAIALHWDPITLAQLGQATSIATTTLPSTLKKLRDDNLIETVASSGSYSAHQMIERFFNIWYLMRHGTRRTKQKMRWLVEFLTSFYSSDELNDIARRAQLKGADKTWRPEYAVAFDEALARCDAQKQATEQSNPSEDADPRDSKIVSDLLTQASAAAKAGDIDASFAFFDQAIEHCRTQGRRRPIPFILFNRAISLRRNDRLEDALTDYNRLITLIEPAKHAPEQELVARSLLNKSVIVGMLHGPVEESAVLTALITRFDQDAALQVFVIRAIINRAILSEQMSDPAAARADYDDIVARFAESDDPKIARHVTQAMYGRAMLLFTAESWAAAIVAFDEVLERDLANVPDHVMEYQAGPLFHQAGALNALGMNNEALAKLDAAIALLEERNDPLDRQRLGAALFNRGVMLRRMDDDAGAEASYTRLLAVCAHPDTVTMQEMVANTLMNLAQVADERGDRHSEMARYDELIARFGASDADGLQPHIAHAMLYRAIVLDEQPDKAPVISAYEAIIERFSAATDDLVREAIAGAMVNLAIALDEAGRYDDALVAFDAMVARFGDDPDPALRGEAAQSLINKAISYNRVDDIAQEQANYREVIRRYGEEPAAEFDDPLARAALYLAVDLEEQADWDGAVQLYEHVLSRPARDARTVRDETAAIIRVIRVRLVDLLIDTAADANTAEQLLDAIEADNPALSRSNRAWIALLRGDTDRAATLAQDIVGLPVSGVVLLQAAIELARGNFGLAMNHVEMALNAPDSEGRFYFNNDCSRLLRVAVKSGFGERLLHWFEETGLAERLAPLYAAFRALVLGEATLRDVSPEIAEPAMIIFQRLVRGGSIVASHDRSPIPRRGRPRRSSRDA